MKEKILAQFPTATASERCLIEKIVELVDIKSRYEIVMDFKKFMSERFPTNSTPFSKDGIMAISVEELRKAIDDFYRDGV